MTNQSSTCVHKKQHSARNYGKTYISYCGKDAVIIDTNDRNLCQKHYNKWINKCNKHKK